MFEYICAVSRDLARHEAAVARWQSKCESFDDDVFVELESEIKAACDALTALQDAIIEERRSRGLEGYEDNEYEDRVRQAIELVEG